MDGQARGVTAARLPSRTDDARTPAQHPGPPVHHTHRRACCHQLVHVTRREDRATLRIAIQRAPNLGGGADGTEAVVRRGEPGSGAFMAAATSEQPVEPAADRPGRVFVSLGTVSAGARFYATSRLAPGSGFAIGFSREASRDGSSSTFSPLPACGERGSSWTVGEALSGRLGSRGRIAPVGAHRRSGIQQAVE